MAAMPYIQLPWFFAHPLSDCILLCHEIESLSLEITGVMLDTIPKPNRIGIKT
jgi:hypothetical protein